MRSRLALLVISLFLSLVPGNVHAQEGIGQKQQEKLLEKKAKEDKKAKVRKEKADRKRHLEIQDKAARKRIKRNTKRADRGGSGAHRDGFFKGLFRRTR